MPRTKRHAKEQLDEIPTAKLLPPDPEEQNDDRASWAEEALITFMVTTGTDAGDALSDLLADFMHWCDRKQLDFAAELERAKNHYDEETYSEPEVYEGTGE